MSKLGMSFKVCQNCRYWSGNRELDGFSKMTEAQSGTKGKCNNIDGFYNLDMGNMATCPHFAPIF